MEFLTDIKLSESDDITFILKRIGYGNTTISFNNDHHRFDEELPNIIVVYKNDQQRYISKMYSSMVSIYNDLLQVSDRCETLTICNNLLKQHITQLETSQQHTTDNFAFCEFSNENLFST